MMWHEDLEDTFNLALETQIPLYLTYTIVSILLKHYPKLT